jgi:hypothetical protein
MAVLKVYNGSSWDVAIGKTYDGSSWVAKMEFYDGSAFVPLYASGPTVITTNIQSNSTSRNIGVCVCYVKIDSDGDFYKSDETGSYSSNGNWLDSGAANEVWVARTITAGTLSKDDIGTGRTSCSSDLEIGTTKSFPDGNKSCTFTLNFYDAASGGNLLASKSITTIATYGSGGP